MSAPLIPSAFRGYVVRHMRGGHLRVIGGESEWTHAGEPTIYREASAAEEVARRTREWDGTRGTRDDLFVVTPAYDGPGEARFVDVDDVPEVTRLRAALAEIAALQPTEPFPHPDDKNDLRLWHERGRHEASSLAAAALAVKP